ncbi:TVP38/TMEM64 family protein [Enterococcus thailandicus]|uniref:TVP38/TMEM64 family protein n=1 Tax=Enterococcus thailandicus TaxID=417368 RepID=UPI0022EBB5BE|nr:VTT domain-containing protein [Enterococcus thailandicus]MDA3965052.1 VTT domain-containing protein [Enterococcus thailandicus]
MKKRIVQIILILCGIGLISFIGYHVYLQYAKDIDILLNPKASQALLQKTVRSHGVITAALLILLTTVMCVVPGIPTSIVGVLVGVSYGPILGSLINISGNTLGNLFAIFLLHHLTFLDQSTKENRWVKAITRMRHPKIGVMIGYMVPVIPSSIVSFTAYTLNLSLNQVALSVILGVLPSSILYACGGEALFHGYNKTAVGIIASVLLLIGLVVIIYKDREKHRLDKEKKSE